MPITIGQTPGRNRKTNQFSGSIREKNKANAKICDYK